MSQEASINPRTVAQSLDTAIEGTRAQGILGSLAADRKQAMMAALAGMDGNTRDGFFQRLMAMTESTATQLIDDVISAGKNAAGSTYTVQKGDSLSRIAKGHGLSLDALIKANPQIKNPDLIHPDQKITLPKN